MGAMHGPVDVDMIPRGQSGVYQRHGFWQDQSVLPHAIIVLETKLCSTEDKVPLDNC